jgi:hypothetical protein
MARSDVRTAVINWLSEATIPDLNQLVTTFPKHGDFQLNSAAGELSRAIGIVFIAGEKESRVAVGGAYSGWKQIDYDVDLQIYHHSLERDAVDAMSSFDAIIDGVKAQLRGGGHRLGLSDGLVIWQAAEPGITVTYDVPQTLKGGAVETWAAVRFTVTQMIQA